MPDKTAMRYMDERLAFTTSRRLHLEPRETFIPNLIWRAECVRLDFYADSAKFWYLH